MTNLITAQDIADFAPDLDTSSYSATTLSGLIAQASLKVAKFCHVKDFAFGSYTDTDRAKISNDGELVISPRVRPVTSVTSITLKKGGFSTSLTLTQGSTTLYQLNDSGTRIHLPNSYLYATGTYLAGGNSQLLTLKAAGMFCTVVYVAGYQAGIPQDLKDACLLYVQDMIVRKVNRSGVQSFTQGSLSMTWGAGGTNEKGESRLLQQANSILLQGDYVRPEVF